MRYAVRLFDRYWWIALGLHAGAAVWLNYLAIYERGHIPYYKDVARVIEAGFNPAAAVYGVPTFPMWGYAWFFVVTEGRTAILIAQELLAVVAAWLLGRQVEQDSFFSPSIVRLFKVVAAASTPWWAFQANIWAAAPVASLCLLAILALAPALGRGRPRTGWLAASAVAFGLALNFRSDCHILAAALWLLLLFWHRFSRAIIGRMLLWFAVSYALLTPWLLYTKHVTGRCLLSSTNGGTTLFTGLGALPNNCWGIGQGDHDPLLHTLLADRFVGRDSPLYRSSKDYSWPDQWTAFPGARSSVNWEADAFLKAEFGKRVLQHPVEFVRKCAVALYRSVAAGAYTGEIFRRCSGYDPAAAGDVYAEMRTELLHHPAHFVAQRGWDAALVLVQTYASVVNRGTIWLSFVALPFVGVSAIRRRSLLVALALTAILCQLALTTLVMQQARFTSNVYLLHVLNVCCVVQLCVRVVRGRADAAPARATTAEMPEPVSTAGE